MSKFQKKGKAEMPELNTSSLPDLIFSILFFFMMVTSMREVELKVEFKVPSGTELEKLERKSLVSYIYIGKPTKDYRAKLGTQSRIQLNDKFADPTHIREGCVVRIINRPTFTAYKHKNFFFKVLEGIIKDTATAPDMEEAAGLDEAE